MIFLNFKLQTLILELIGALECELWICAIILLEIWMSEHIQAIQAFRI